MRIAGLFVLVLMSFTSIAMPIKVMTYNLRLNTESDGVNAWPNRADKVVSLIAKYDPDIIGVQEALDNQMQDLVRLLPQYTYVGVGRDDGKTKGEYSAIFYKKGKFEVMMSSTFWLSEQPAVPGSKSWDAAITRVATWAVMKAKTGESFFILNTHFDHMGKEARTNSARLIVEKIPQLCGGLRAIVTGDLNCTRDEPPYAALTTHTYKLIDPAPANPPGTYCTFSVGTECRAIDYILHSLQWKVNSYTVINDNDGKFYPSDHLPVMVEVE